MTTAQVLTIVLVPAGGDAQGWTARVYEEPGWQAEGADPEEAADRLEALARRLLEGLGRGADVAFVRVLGDGEPAVLARNVLIQYCRGWPTRAGESSGGQFVHKAEQLPDLEPQPQVA